jgi:hypothetical protein
MSFVETALASKSKLRAASPCGYYEGPEHECFRVCTSRPMGGWRRPFDDPIPVPRGREFVTLKDAGTYITKLPKAEHEAPEWQAAMQALILVATEGGPTMFARIAVQRTLSRHQQQRTKPAAEGNQKA